MKIFFNIGKGKLPLLSAPHYHTYYSRNTHRLVRLSLLLYLKYANSERESARELKQSSGIKLTSFNNFFHVIGVAIDSEET